MNEKVKGYLNIANKGGYLIIGQDTLKNYTKKLYVILVDESAGNNIFKLASNISADYDGIPIRKVKQLGELLSISKCKILGIKNKGLADKVLENLDRGEI